MISASEARVAVIKSKMEFLEKHVREASSHGAISITITDTRFAKFGLPEYAECETEKQIVGVLEKLGYKVRFGVEGDERYMEVNWE